MRIECFGLAHEPVRPLHRQEICLFQEIEELVVRPFRIGEALVFRIGLGDRLYLLAGHALDRVGPEIEIGLAQTRLQFQRALRIAQPIIRHLADGFHHVHDLGILVVVVAFFARLEIGGQGLTALFHHARDVAGELLHVGGAAFGGFCWGSHGNASIVVRRRPPLTAFRVRWTLATTAARRIRGVLVRHVARSRRGRCERPRSSGLNLALVILERYS